MKGMKQLPDQQDNPRTYTSIIADLQPQAEGALYIHQLAIFNVLLFAQKKYTFTYYVYALIWEGWFGSSQLNIDPV
jgi:hypothetical protein